MAQRKSEFLINRINFEYSSKGIYFKLGKNMHYIELHILGLMDDNIEIGMSKSFSRKDMVEVFDPFYQKSRIQAQMSLVDRFGLNIKRNDALIGDIDDLVI